MPCADVAGDPLVTSCPVCGETQSSTRQSLHNRASIAFYERQTQQKLPDYVRRELEQGPPVTVSIETIMRVEGRVFRPEEQPEEQPALEQRERPGWGDQVDVCF